MIARIVVTNQLFYWQKTLLVVCLLSVLFFITGASFVFTGKIRELADKPLQSLETEIILQKDRVNKNAQTVKTKGNILPFNLESFSKAAVLDDLANVKEVKDISTALVFWQFDLSNTVTVIGLDINEPPVGVRKISTFLMPGGRFFESNSGREVILERHFSQLFGFKIGGPYRMGNEEYRIVGIVDFKEQSNLSNAQVFMPYETAVRAVGSEGLPVNQVYVSLGKATLLDPAKMKISSLLPDFSVITKDKLLANLSNLNGMFYRFGDYLVAGISLAACMLAVWMLKIYRLEFREQNEIFRILGWPGKSTRLHIFTDISLILVFSCIAALVLISVFELFIVPGIKIDSLLNQGFKL